MGQIDLKYIGLHAIRQKSTLKTKDSFKNKQKSSIEACQKLIEMGHFLHT